MGNSYFVYKHTCSNGKVYIGITCQTPSKRWHSGKGYYRNKYFTSAIEKYGWENIKHEILFDSLTQKEAEAKEIELIAFYKSNQREYGYNLSVGGECTALKYTEPLVCPVCGKSFKKKDSDSKYCCRVCAKKATAHNIEYNGETHTATEWSAILGICRDTIIGRHNKGYDIVKGNTARFKTCVICGKEFIPKKRNAGLCCSSKCARKYASKEKPKAICRQCGKEFTVERDRKGLYCSRECQWQSMRKEQIK